MINVDVQRQRRHALVDGLQVLLELPKVVRKDGRVPEHVRRSTLRIRLLQHRPRRSILVDVLIARGELSWGTRRRVKQTRVLFFPGTDREVARHNGSYMLERLV